MEHDDTVSSTGDSITIALTRYQLQELVTQHTATNVVAELSPQTFSSAVKKRIATLCSKGIITRGSGLYLIRNTLFIPERFGLPFFVVFSRRDWGPNRDIYKLRPRLIKAVNATPEMKQALKDYHVVDVTRWNMLTGGGPLPYGCDKTRSELDLDLTGVATMSVLTKHFSSIVMTPERKEQGETILKRFNELKTIRLEA